MHRKSLAIPGIPFFVASRRDFLSTEAGVVPIPPSLCARCVPNSGRAEPSTESRIELARHSVEQWDQRPISRFSMHLRIVRHTSTTADRMTEVHRVSSICPTAACSGTPALRGTQVDLLAHQPVGNRQDRLQTRIHPYAVLHPATNRSCCFHRVGESLN